MKCIANGIAQRLASSQYNCLARQIIHNGPSKIYGTQLLKNWRGMVCLKQDCLPQILLSPFWNTLTHLTIAKPWRAAINLRTCVGPTQPACTCSKWTMENQNNVWNLFKVNSNNNDVVLVSLLSTLTTLSFTYFAGRSIVDFEQLNPG